MNEDLRNVSDYLICCGASSSVANTVVNHSHFQTSFLDLQRRIAKDSSVKKKDKLPSALYVTLRLVLEMYACDGLKIEPTKPKTSNEDLLVSALDNVNALAHALIHVLFSALIPFSDKFTEGLRHIPILSAEAKADHDLCLHVIEQALDTVIDVSKVSIVDTQVFKEARIEAYWKSAYLAPPKKGLFGNKWKRIELLK